MLEGGDGGEDDGGLVGSGRVAVLEFEESLEAFTDDVGVGEARLVGEDVPGGVEGGLGGGWFCGL